MKRSEMVTECVLAIEDTDRMTRKVLSRKDIVEAVLDRAEELGMLPPLSPIKYPESDSPLNKWEGEDSEAQECCGRGCHE